MSHRLDAAYELAAQYRLDPEATARLAALATPPQPDAKAMRTWFWRAVAVLAAALGGLGVIIWLAANWGNWGRLGRFALLQSVILIMSIGAAWQLRRWLAGGKTVAGHHNTASALGLMAMLTIGGLFAYFGQTYQTGADPWQLFALWAALALPLALALRNDIVWTPWAVVAATAISLWLYAHSQHSWSAGPENFTVHIVAWGMASLLIFLLSPALRHFSGAGLWSLRTAVTLTVIGVTVAAVAALFESHVAPQYLLALILFAAGCAALAQRRFFDIYALSALALGLVTLVMAGLARAIFEGSRSDPFGALIMLGLITAALLAAAVKFVMHCAARYAAAPSAPSTPSAPALASSSSSASSSEAAP